MSARWTPARIAALRAFSLNGYARESNETRVFGASAIVYWQSMRWLREQGLVQTTFDYRTFELTPAGVKPLAELGPRVEQLSMLGEEA